MVNKAKEEKTQLLVSLIFDEMSIKKGLQRHRNGTMRGYADFGSFFENDNSDNLPIAKES